MQRADQRLVLVADLGLGELLGKAPDLAAAGDRPSSSRYMACTKPPSWTVPSLALKRTGITWPVSV
jgi:hypothetical protein